MADTPGKSPYKGAVRGTEGGGDSGGGLATPKDGGGVMNQTTPTKGGAPYVHKGKYAASERGTEC